jgi:hypothetical protein
MKSEQEFLYAISAITLEIKTQFPDMSQYLGSPPLPDHTNPAITISTLRDYYASLAQFMLYYKRYHLQKTQSTKN